MKLYRPYEAAIICGLDYRRLRQWIHRGVLAITVVEHAPMVEYHELRRVVAERMPKKNLELLDKAADADHEPIENGEA